MHRIHCLRHLLHLMSKHSPDAHSHTHSHTGTHHATSVAFVTSCCLHNIKLTFLLIVESLYLTALAFLHRFDTVIIQCLNSGIVFVGTDMSKLKILKADTISRELVNESILDKICNFGSIFREIQRRYILLA